MISLNDSGSSLQFFKLDFLLDELFFSAVSSVEGESSMVSKVSA